MAKTTEILVAELDSSPNGVEQTSPKSGEGSATGLVQGCYDVRNTLPPATMLRPSKVHGSFYQLGDQSFFPLGTVRTHSHLTHKQRVHDMTSSQIFIDYFCQLPVLQENVFSFPEIKEIERKYKSRGSSYRALIEASHQNEIS